MIIIIEVRNIIPQAIFLYDLEHITAVGSVEEVGLEEHFLMHISECLANQTFVVRLTFPIIQVTYH